MTDHHSDHMRRGFISAIVSPIQTNPAPKEQIWSYWRHERTPAEVTADTESRVIGMKSVPGSVGRSIVLKT
jgi:hypothetical protein